MSVYTGPDAISAQLFTALEEKITSYKSAAGQLAAADGDREKAVTQFVESSDDPQAVKLREAIKKAQERLKALAEEKVVSITLPEEEKEKLRVAVKELGDQVRTGFQTIEMVSKSLGNDTEGVQKALASLDNPVKSNRGRKPGTTGSSLPRVSVNVTVISEAAPDKPREFDNMAKAATYLEMEAKDLQLLFAEAAGVEHSEIKTVDKPVEFTVKPANSSVMWTVKTEPKERAKPGPKKSAA